MLKDAFVVLDKKLIEPNPVAAFKAAQKPLQTMPSFAYDAQGCQKFLDTFARIGQEFDYLQEYNEQMEPETQEGLRYMNESLHEGESAIN